MQQIEKLNKYKPNFIQEKLTQMDERPKWRC